jgi:hypothetical protein
VPCYACRNRRASALWRQLAPLREQAENDGAARAELSTLQEQYDFLEEERERVRGELDSTLWQQRASNGSSHDVAAHVMLQNRRILFCLAGVLRMHGMQELLTTFLPDSAAAWIGSLLWPQHNDQQGKRIDLSSLQTLPAPYILSIFQNIKSSSVC